MSDSFRALRCGCTSLHTQITLITDRCERHVSRSLEVFRDIFIKYFYRNTVTSLPFLSLFFKMVLEWTLNTFFDRNGQNSDKFLSVYYSFMSNFRQNSCETRLQKKFINEMLCDFASNVMNQNLKDCVICLTCEFFEITFCLWNTAIQNIYVIDLWFWFVISRIYSKKAH